MCGIAGIYDYGRGVVERAELAAMVSLLQPRGPDGTGFYTGPGVGLAHSRLSIIDLAGGQQPIHNEDQTVWTVFNGEIFNYVELRDELIRRGHHFATRSDTEVIVHLYEEYGEDFVHHLNGQFAIALWDLSQRKLLLIRDRPGILPLFYAEHNGRLVFGSEIKALLPVLGRTPALNPAGLDQLMTFWAPLSPETMFDGIYEVPPGEMLVLSQGKRRRRRYWDWSFPTEASGYRRGSEQALAQELHDLLLDSTRLRLRSDVPVAAYLSGGLDSSVVTSLIHHYGGVPLRTFSVGFEDAALDEGSYQRQMIERLGADHSFIRCRNEDIAQGLLDVVWRTETPLLRMAPVPMAMLSKLVHSQGYRVVLTGEGADEALGGYDIFKETKLRQFWARQPQSRWRPLLLKRLYPYLPLSQLQSPAYLQSFFGKGLEQPDLPYFSHLMRWASTAMCKDFFSSQMRERVRENAIDRLEAALPAQMTAWAPFNRAQYLEAKTLLPSYLLSSQGDRMLMANSVEGRFPFLDHRVIEFANSLPAPLKMKVLNEKYLLKQAMARYLPREIVQRYKQPYRAPDIAAFFAARPPEYVQELLSPSALRSAGYFDPARVERLLAKVRAGRAIGNKDNMAFVGILSTQIWHHWFVDGFRTHFAAPASEPSIRARASM
jgi:asparagine synthase (glutamine-hydrolysing)